MSESLQERGGKNSDDRDLPESLVAEARDTFRVGRTDGINDKAGLDMRGLLPDVECYNAFAFHQHSYVTDYIKLADQKAAFTFTLSAGLFCYLFKNDVHKMWLRNPTTWTAIDFICLLSMLGLGIAIFASCAVVVPWLCKSHRGFVYFRSVAEFESATGYASDVLALPPERLIRAILQHTYDLSRACSVKYSKLGVALWSATIGTFMTVLVLLAKA